MLCRSQSYVALQMENGTGNEDQSLLEGRTWLNVWYVLEGKQDGQGGGISTSSSLSWWMHLAGWLEVLGLAYKMAEMLDDVA